MVDETRSGVGAKVVNMTAVFVDGWRRFIEMV